MRVTVGHPVSRAALRPFAAVVAVAVGVFAFGGPQARAATALPSVTLTKVGTAAKPVLVLPAPSGGPLLVVEQGGRIRPLIDGNVGAAVYDVSTDVSTGNEQGLLGAAFSNDGQWLFTNHTDRSGASLITATPWNGTTAATARTVELLRVDQPYANHNGGGLVVDRQGVLWIGLGDGGSAGDPENRAQNLRTHLGKILRIVPTPGKATSYSIPAGNISATQGLPEIWGYGLRNPWRFSIDNDTSRIWIGDVGQNLVEEVNSVSVSAKAPNFGWRRREGNVAFKGKAFKPGQSVEPTYTYLRSSGGCSVTGGVVYRGSAIPALRGTYLFSDYCDGTIRTLPATGNTTAGQQKRSTPLGVKAEQVSSFGVDAAGEVYVTSLGGSIYRIDPR